MNTNQTEQITTSQAVMFMTNFILGAGILILPRVVTEKVQTPDSWISVIISGILISIVALILVQLCKRYPNDSFFQFNQKIIGKWLGIPISIVVIIYYIILSAFEVRAMAETTRLFLLQGTPTWAIIFPFLWIGLYIVHGGVNPIARLLEIIFPITVLCFLLVIFLGYGIIDFDNLRPVLGNGIKPVIKGVFTTSLSFSGYEVILFIFMFMSYKNKGSQVVLIGIGTTFVFYAITLVAVIGAFSVPGVILQTWPVLTYVRSYEIPGLIFERFDSILLVIWIMQIFTTYIIAFYIAAQGMSHIFKKRSINPFIFWMTPFIYIIAMIPRNINETFEMAGLISSTTTYLFCVIPILLLIISIVRRKIDEKV